MRVQQISFNTLVFTLLSFGVLDGFSASRSLAQAESRLAASVKGGTSLEQRLPKEHRQAVAVGAEKEQTDYSDFDQLLGEWSATCYFEGRAWATFRLVASRNGPIIRFVNPGPVRGIRDLEWMTGTIVGKRISDSKWSATYPRTGDPEEANCPLHGEPVYVHVIDPAKEIRTRFKITVTKDHSCTLKDDRSNGPCVLTRP